MSNRPARSARPGQQGATATLLLTLGLGLAAGWLGATALLGEAPEPAAGARTAERAGPSTASRGAASSEPAAPAAGGPAAPSAATQPSRRSAVGAREATASAEPESALPAELSPTALSLQAELRDFLGSADLEGYLLQNEERGAAFLFDYYLKVGDPLAALSLMERQPSLNLPRWGTVANALREGHPGMANRALELGVRAAADSGVQWSSPLSDWLVTLESHDPARALALFEQVQVGFEAGNADAQLAQARLLRKGRRAEESRALLLDLIEQEQNVLTALSELGRVDPEVAETELLTRLGAQPYDDNLRGELLTLLSREGRTDDALEIIESALSMGRMTPQMYDRALANLPAALLAREVDGWVERVPPGQQVLGKLARHFEQVGEPERAMGFALDAWDSTIEGSGNALPRISDALLTHDRGRVMANLDRARSNAGSRDEVWGDLGDHYWRLGQWDDAIAAYRQARELDPSDGEWRSKVDKIDKQVAPLNGASMPPGWGN